MIRSFPVLPLLATACVSTPSPLAPALEGTVGVPHLGVQTGAVELPRAGEGFVRFRPHGRAYWGLPRLVDAVEGAARHVARVAPGGAPLVVGDLSARKGGKIPGHNSHRTGRDVDLLYYATTPSGVPVRTPGFFDFGPDGLAFVPETGEFVRLDVERQWELFKYLVSRPEVGIQFLFVSRDVEALIIDHALARGESLELVWRAQTVLLEPTDSLPHADHVHVRIACRPEEGISGCSGGGPYWPWLPELAPPVTLAEPELERIALEDPLVDDAAPAPAAPVADADEALPGGA